MRPCDGTSGLVRVNRRKAVFAFKGLFSGGFCCVSCLGTLGFTAVCGSAGKNRKPPSITRFLTTKPQVAEVRERGLVGRSRIFPALPESTDGSMRQILKPSNAPAFSRKETAGRSVVVFRCGRHIWNLPHTSEFGPCDGLRLLRKSAR